jgi:hypothetical protein
MQEGILLAYAEKAEDDKVKLLNKRIRAYLRHFMEASDMQE